VVLGSFSALLHYREYVCVREAEAGKRMDDDWLTTHEASHHPLPTKFMRRIDVAAWRKFKSRPAVDDRLINIMNMETPILLFEIR